MPPPHGLARAGVAVTVLPATIFIDGADAKHNARPRPDRGAQARRERRAVLGWRPTTCSILSSPFGDCSLLRMANLYANVAYGRYQRIRHCLDLVTAFPRGLMNLRDYGIAPATRLHHRSRHHHRPRRDRGLPDVLMGFKNGRQVFERHSPVRFPPG